MYTNLTATSDKIGFCLIKDKLHKGVTENKSVSFLNALNKNCSFAMHPVKPFSVLMPLILVCKVNL